MMCVLSIQKERSGFVAQQAKTKPETLVIKLASDEIEPESR